MIGNTTCVRAKCLRKIQIYNSVLCQTGKKIFKQSARSVNLPDKVGRLSSRTFYILNAKYGPHDIMRAESGGKNACCELHSCVVTASVIPHTTNFV